MVGTGSIVPARSRQQALDWSLVLLSQGIESEVELTADGQWQILLDPAQFGEAARVLRLYCLENRRRPEAQRLATKLLFDWGHAWFFALLVLIFTLSETALPDLRGFGLMDRSFFAGDWWRPITAVLLHQNAAHLAANATIGMLFLGFAGGMLGTWPAFLMSYASGVIAYIIGAAILGDNYHSIGASGMVMGALGLLTSFSIAHAGELDRGKLALRGVAGGLLLLVLLGFDPHPHTDVLAHVSGFFVGLLLGLLTLVIQRRFGRSRLSFPTERVT